MCLKEKIWNRQMKMKAVIKLKCLAQISCESGDKQENYWRLKRLAGNQQFSEVVKSLSHSEYWFCSNNAWQKYNFRK